MLIVNKNHHLHTLPTIPLGRADQGQHAAAQQTAEIKAGCSSGLERVPGPQYSNTVVILQLQQTQTKEEEKTDSVKLINVWRRAD